VPFGLSSPPAAAAAGAVLPKEDSGSIYTTGTGSRLRTHIRVVPRVCIARDRSWIGPIPSSGICYATPRSSNLGSACARELATPIETSWQTRTTWDIWAHYRGYNECVDRGPSTCIWLSGASVTTQERHTGDCSYCNTAQGTSMQGSARSPSPKPKSDSAAADFTKVRFSGPEVQVQFRGVQLTPTLNRHQIESPKRPTKSTTRGRLPQSICLNKRRNTN
jgi:hypothetical protein